MEKTEAIARAQQGAAPPSQVTPANDVGTLLRDKKKQIEESLAGMIDPDLFVATAIAAVRNTPKLAQANRASLLDALLRCAQLGLMPNTIGEAYILPYENRNEGRIDAQLIIGYQGLISLVRRSGFVDSITAQVVREGDFFDFEFGLDEKLRHVPKPDASGAVIYAYAYAKMKGGGYHFEVMTRAEIDRIRAAAPGSRKPGGPWEKHFDEMARKTVVRRIVKYLPKSTRMIGAIADMERQEGREAPNPYELTPIDDITPGISESQKHDSAEEAAKALSAAADAPEQPKAAEGTPKQEKAASDDAERQEPPLPKPKKRGRPKGSKNNVDPRPAPADPTADFPIDEAGRTKSTPPDLKPGQSIDLLTGEIRDAVSEDQERKNREAAEKSLASVPGFDD